VYSSVSVTTIVDTEGLITIFVAPLASAARSEPAPPSLPFVTFAGGAANATAGTSKDANKNEAKGFLIFFSRSERKERR
jgi:hypothetical protein